MKKAPVFLTQCIFCK